MTATPTRSSAAPAARFAFLALALVVALSGIGNAFAQGDETHGAYSVIFDRDGFTDENRNIILSMPTDFRSGWSEDNKGFGMMCMVDGLNVVVMWGKFFGGDRNDQVTVRYRFDDRPSPAPTGWTMFSNSETAWMPMRLVDEFVATARSSHTLLLSVTDPLDGETIVNTFSLDGFGTALDRILPCD